MRESRTFSSSHNSYFNNPSRITLGLYASAIFLPSIVTAFVGDWIAAKFGRKPAVLIGSVLIITGALLNGLAQNPGQFVGGRVILGSGGAITKVGAPALLHEIAHPRLRGTLGGIYYAVYYMGSGTSGLLCRESCDHAFFWKLHYNGARQSVNADKQSPDSTCEYQ